MIRARTAAGRTGRVCGRRQVGFTLLEILVATAIFAIFAYMAYGGLNAIIRQQYIAGESALRLREVQYAVRRLTQDLGQLQPRSVREELGEGWKQALQADGRDIEAIELTRGGWGNPLGRPRSTLQRVAYRLEDDVLIRVQWPVLDRLLDQEPTEREVLTGVVEFRIRFLPPDGEWSDVWPANEAIDNSAGSTRQLPRAVEFLIELEDWGEITRLVEVTG